MTFEQFKQVKYFSGLDGLRAVAVLAVVWHHTAAKYFSIWPILSRGYLGVDVFFAVSGFLIAHLLIAEKEKRGSIAVGKFYGRRALRIYPLYYLVLLAYIILVWVVEKNSVYGQQFWINLPYFLTFTSNWFVGLNDTRVIFYIAWSLATEEQFYLVWPWVEKWVGSWTKFVILGLFVLMAPAAGISAAICLGVGLAHMLNNKEGFNLAVWMLEKWWMGIGVFVIAVARFPGSELVMGGVSAILVGTVVIGKMLENKVLGWVGKISYGIYLMHMLVYHLVTILVVGNVWWLNFGLTVGGVIGVASLSYLVWERPWLRLKER